MPHLVDDNLHVSVTDAHKPKKGPSAKPRRNASRINLDIVEQNPVEPARITQTTLSVVHAGGSGQPELLRFHGIKATVPAYREFPARMKSDPQLVLRYPSVIGGDMLIKKRNRLFHAEIDAGPVVIEMIPTRCVRRNASNVHIYIQIT